jgi:hypothetical protein
MRIRTIRVVGALSFLVGVLASPASAVVISPITTAPILRGANILVSVTEFLPNPSGDATTEWIELHDDDDASVELDGWFLDDDGGSKPFSLSGITIPVNGYLVIPQSQSRIILNNDRDSVRLIAPDGSVHESISYARPPKGKSYALSDGVWSWSATPTPGAANPAVVTPPVSATGSGPKAMPTDLRDIAAVNAGALVAVEGVVTLPPGRLGTRTFMVQAVGGGQGAVVRAFGNKPFPKIVSGDVVRVTARTEGSSHGAPLLQTTGDEISPVSKSRVTFASRSLADLSETDAGIAVTVDGSVASMGNQSMTIMDDLGKKDVTVIFPQGSQKKIADDSEVEVSGVALAEKNGLEMQVLDPTDVKTVAPPQDVAAANPPDSQDAPTPADASAKPPPFSASSSEKNPFVLGGIAVAAILAAAGFFIVRKRRLDRMNELITFDSERKTRP